MSGSASCTVFMPGTGGAGKCGENERQVTAKTTAAKKTGKNAKQKRS